MISSCEEERINENGILELLLLGCIQEEMRDAKAACQRFLVQHLVHEKWVPVGRLLIPITRHGQRTQLTTRSRDPWAFWGQKSHADKYPLYQNAPRPR
jgi:hypothetical protein